MSYIGTEPKDIRSFGRTKFDYTATQGQTAFTGADDDGKVLAFTVGQIEVYVNGILMDDSDFTTTGTGTVTLASAANLNDVINIVSFESNIPDNDYVPASGGTFSGNVTHSGTVTNSGNVTVGGTLGVTGVTTLSDDLVVDTNTLFADASTNRVGIGTASPAAPLDVTKAGGGNFVALFQNTTDATPYGIHVKDASSGANGYPLFQVTNGAANTTYFRVDSGTGRVLAPSQPSFCVRGGTGNHTISAGLGNANAFNSANSSTVFHNVGNHFNQSNTFFTAPTAGKYLFTYNIYSQTTGGTAGGYIGAWLLFSNTRSYVYCFQENGSDVNLTMSVIASMASGDTVNPGLYGHSGRTQHYIGQHSYFEGHLLG